LGRNGVHGASGSPSDSGVWGENSNGGFGVSGSTNSQSAAGVWGDNQGTGQGVKGTSAGGDAVLGISKSKDHAGVSGRNDSGGTGIWATGVPAGHFAGAVEVTGYLYSNSVKATATGIFGPEGRAGVQGESPHGDGVLGICTSNDHAGVSGVNDSGGTGISARGTPGVFGTSNTGEGVHGESNAATWAAVAAINKGGGPGLWASGVPAGHFVGNVEVTGDVILTGQDLAEDFNLSRDQQIEPGTVMVIDDEDTLQVSNQAYDRRVAGVVSGAGNLRPAIVLGRLKSGDNRLPIALIGKVCCKVDAGYARIEVGDLLTTSPTAGHAMRATDPLDAFGSVIGKALRPLSEGRGLIPILIALR
jgi:hypothetical protein